MGMPLHRLLNALLLVFVGLFLEANAQEALHVPKEITLNRSEIRLEDLFPALPEDHPAHGLELKERTTYDKPLTLKARHLRLLARKHKINWTLPKEFSTCTIYRKGTVLEENTLRSDLKNALLVPEEAQVQINRWPKIVVENPQDCRIGKVQNNPKTQLFSAEILARPLDASQEKVFRVYGRILEEIDVPVLKTAKQPGQPIQENDLKTVKLPKQKAHSNTLLNPSDIIGLAPKRRLSAEVPLRTGDLEKPVLVQKGGVMSVHFQKGGIKLSLKAKAKKKGALGDVIGFEGYDPKKVIYAKIVSPNQAVVNF